MGTMAEESRLDKGKGTVVASICSDSARKLHLLKARSIIRVMINNLKENSPAQAVQEPINRSSLHEFLSTNGFQSRDQPRSRFTLAMTSLLRVLIGQELHVQVM